jgi:hypothetical protein
MNEQRIYNCNGVFEMFSRWLGPCRAGVKVRLSKDIQDNGAYREYEELE